MTEPKGLTQRELLDLFDRCEAHPTIREAIRGILQPDAARQPPDSGLRKAGWALYHNIVDEDGRRYAASYDVLDRFRAALERAES